MQRLLIRELLLSTLRERFPSAFLMYRSTTERIRDDPKDNHPIASFQLNQSAKALMRKLGVPMFNCTYSRSRGSSTAR